MTAMTVNPTKCFIYLYILNILHIFLWTTHIARLKPRPNAARQKQMPEKPIVGRMACNRAYDINALAKMPIRLISHLPGLVVLYFQSPRKHVICDWLPWQWWVLSTKQETRYLCPWRHLLIIRWPSLGTDGETYSLKPIESDRWNRKVYET